MASLAKVTLVGNLGRDPETRYTPNGTMNVMFSIAVSRRRNDQSGQPVETTNWYRVTAWGRLAETLDQLSQNGALVKGKQVFVMGNLEAREYQDQNNQTRTSLDVRADEVQLLGSRSDAGAGYGGGAPRGPQNAPGDMGDADLDEVPF